MAKKERLFRFKQFSVSHARSAMKVGVDGVLLGVWANVGDGSCRILDAGCGCGLIALMAAQRNPQAIVDAVDIDEASATEAGENFKNSPWSDRVRVRLGDFMNETGLYDHILSNPPFFTSGVNAYSSSRMLARHTSQDFGPVTLLTHGATILRNGGTISLIAVIEDEERLIVAGLDAGMEVHRRAHVVGREGGAPKRVMLEMIKHDEISQQSVVVDSELICIECCNDDGTFEYSTEYKKLCKDFYLKF